MNIPNRLVAPLAISIAVLLPEVRADEVEKLQNATALNTAAAWADGFVPDGDDIIVWNNLYTTPGAIGTLSQLGGDMSVLGLKVTDVGGALNTNATVVGFQNTGSANTLTIGAAGIDMSAARQALRLQSKIVIGADQTWNITNANTNTSPSGNFNNGEDLSFETLTAGAAFNLGGKVVSVIGNGAVTITSGFTLSNGTISIANPNFTIQGGGNRVTNINNDVVLDVQTGGRLHLQSNSGAGGASLTSAATINLKGGTLTFCSNNATNTVIQSGAINVLAPSTIAISKSNTNDGNVGPLNFTGNLTGSAALTINNDQPVAQANRLNMSGNNSAYSGTVTLTGLAGKTTRLSSATAGSAAATWNVTTGHTLEINGVSVSLGTLTGGGSITNVGSIASTLSIGAGNFGGSISDGAVFNGIGLAKVGPGTLTLTSGNTYTGPTLVNAGALVARTNSLGFTPVTVADGARFGVSLAAVGGVQTLPALAVGTAIGGGVTFDLGTFGNPTVAPLYAQIFSVASGTQIIVAGSGFTNGLSFPLLDYDGAIGGAGFAGLSLILPPRVTGMMTDNALTTTIDLQITGTDAPKWTGLVNGNWDIEGTPGTANWQEIVNGGATRYIQTSTRADSVLFDDSAGGTTNIVLTTTLTPASVTFNNSAKNYSFSGSGSISGSTGIVKNGTGTVRLSNTALNDYAGATVINAGAIELGDGVTVGAGTLGPSAVTVDGSLVLNRPDTFTIPNAITGLGGLTKLGAAGATLSGAVSLNGNVVIGGGGLTFTGGATLSGSISGSGSVTAAGGTVLFTGTNANTYAGLTTVSNGALQLNKTGVVAVPANLLITGTGGFALQQAEQIADTATLTYNKTGNNQGNVVLGNAGAETIAEVRVVNGADTGSQLQGHSGLVVSGTLKTENTAVFSVASGHSVSVGGLDVNGTSILRIAGNSNFSTLNVGTLGILASGGTIQVGQGVGAFDALLSLMGNVVTTGNLLFNDGALAAIGPKREINLAAGNHDFNIGAGTTTIVRPVIAGDGGITKLGGGTLDLLGSATFDRGVATYTGPTLINAGTLITDTRQAGTASFSVAGGATLQVRVANAGTSLITGSLTSAPSSRVAFDLGTLGNPTAAALVAPSITTGAGTTLAVLGTTTPGTFPLLAYDNINPIGGAGFAGFALSLPLRVAGSLVDNAAAGTVDVNIIGIDTLKWNGNVSNAWDIDNGGGTGTANWRGDLSGSALKYLQGAGGSDKVILDDSATGTTGINLTTTLTPNGITANISAKNYTLTGTGRITGTGGIAKSGTGTLTLGNSGTNDFSGGILISGGTLVIGDGVTVGAGTFGTGAVQNDGMLVLNRADDFTLANVITGTGAIVKNAGNTITVPIAANLTVPIAINSGSVSFNAGGSLTGPLTGAGSLTISGGTLQIGGLDPNTISGLTSVNAGVLQLNKPAGVNATGGNITINGTAQLELLAGEQIADTATVTLVGSSTNSILSAAGLPLETVANVVVNSSVGGAPGGQIIMRNGMTITGTGTINSGILGIASGHTATANAINITGTDTTTAILRIAGSGGPSIFNVGPGGITASGGDIQVKFNTNNQDATLNLGGDFTATGNVVITNAGYTGANLNVINLLGTRIFDIAAGTTTTVAPDIADTVAVGGQAGGIAKIGGGMLLLTSAVTGTYTGETNLAAGVLEVNGSLSGTSVSVNGGTLSGTGSILTGALGFDFNAGGHLAPGPFGSIGTLTINTDTNSLDLIDGVTAPSSASLLFDLGDVLFSDRVNIPVGTLSIGAGVLEFNDFVFSAQAGLADQQTYTLFDSAAPIAGALGPNRTGLVAGFQAELQFGDNGQDIVLFIPEPGSATLLLGGLALLLGPRRRNRQARD